VQRITLAKASTGNNFAQGQFYQAPQNNLYKSSDDSTRAQRRKHNNKRSNSSSKRHISPSINLTNDTTGSAYS
jgi:hypothetical protein